MDTWYINPFFVFTVTFCLSDVMNLKDQVTTIKRELKDEMKNIKQVMTSLFEVQQMAMMS